MKTCILLTVLLCGYASSELYTALADLEELVQTEAVLINTLEAYIHAQEQKLNLLRRYAHTYQNQQYKAGEDIQMYVSNPINAYLLIKRLTTDWKKVETLMSTNVGQDSIANLTEYRSRLKFPSDEDLNGAAEALTRLQNTYRLDTSSLARGELNGVKYSSELSASDCFELGMQSYNNGDYYHCQLWMIEADARLGRETNETIERSDILEYLAFSTFKEGNVMLALDLTNILLEIVPSHQRALGNKAFYEETIEKTSMIHKTGEEEIASKEPVHYDEGKELYEQLCRGDLTMPEEVSRKLKCRYVHNNNPFLRICPFKMEEAFTEPKILVYHDVMSDNEISTIKRLAHPRLNRAGVLNSVSGASEPSQIRISKAAWLKDAEHKHVVDVVQRVEDMTGLTQTTSEELQVVNYGIGGHYESHFDFVRKGEKNAFKRLGTGNRIATVLFYMSDIPQGGATVFPNIKAALWPRKGSAAFWYNLHSNGEGDIRTRHAACPVLAGSKWVSNKWIHERGQEFIRPCGLTQPPPELTA